MVNNDGRNSEVENGSLTLWHWWLAALTFALAGLNLVLAFAFSFKVKADFDFRFRPFLWLLWAAGRYAELCVLERSHAGKVLTL